MPGEGTGKLVSAGSAGQTEPVGRTGTPRNAAPPDQAGVAEETGRPRNAVPTEQAGVLEEQWNPVTATRPEQADVIVVGAGPTGSAAALVLARSGVDVVLVDRARFPREKVCGDALIPDALAVLRRLGLLDRVRTAGCSLAGARVVAPGGTVVDLSVDVITLPRRHLDHILADAARSAGARFLEGVTVEGPVWHEGRVAGVVGHCTGRAESVEIRAPLVILATGAAGRVLDAFRVLRRSRPHAIALRGYFRAPAAEPDRILFSYERALLPGYAWVFPLGDGTFNVGVIRFLRRNGSQRFNLQHDLQGFLHDSPMGRRVLARAEALGAPRGAPIRTGLRGSRPWRPGLLLAGEALGTTYAATGEGIGKAMESGCMAAEVALEALRAATIEDADHVLADYPERVRRHYAAIHRAYRVVQRWVRVPWVVDLVARRAAHDGRVRALLEAILREEERASRLVSFSNLVRLALAPVLSHGPPATSRCHISARQPAPPPAASNEWPGPDRS